MVICASIGAWKRNFPAFLGHYDRPTNQLTIQPTHGRTWGFFWKLPFQLWIVFHNLSKLKRFTGPHVKPMVIPYPSLKTQVERKNEKNPKRQKWRRKKREKNKTLMFLFFLFLSYFYPLIMIMQESLAWGAAPPCQGAATTAPSSRGGTPAPTLRADPAPPPPRQGPRIRPCRCRLLVCCLKSKLSL